MDAVVITLLVLVTMTVGAFALLAVHKLFKHKP